MQNTNNVYSSYTRAMWQLLFLINFFFLDIFKQIFHMFNLPQICYWMSFPDTTLLILSRLGTFTNLRTPAAE